jgi:drug/metabolite transporter (DMT)-like permease
MLRPRHTPYLLLLLALLFWAGNLIASRGLHGTVPPIGLAFWRWLVASALILPVALPRILRQRSLFAGAWRWLLVLSVVGVTGYNTLLYLAVQTTTATNAAVIMASIPALIVALSWLLFGERIRPRQMLGVALALAGVVVLITRGDPAVLRALALRPGDLWALTAAVSWALYSVLLRHRPAGMDQIGFLGVTFVVGLGALTPFYLWEVSTGARMRFDAATVAVVGYVAVFASILAWLFWNRAVAAVGAYRAGLSLYLNPVLGMLLAMIFLGERIERFQLAGMAGIVAGIWLATGQPPGPGKSIGAPGPTRPSGGEP